MRVSTSRRKNRRLGFTLIEMMITVAIVGILAAIALPMYFETITRGKIIDATTRLGDFRSKMEKYFADNRTYLDAGGAACGIPNPPVGAGDYFALTCGPPGPAPTATTYTLVATGIPGKGMSGFRYLVDQTNLKSSFGPAGWAGNATCWATRKDGSC
jgi:type IV pilus assembly protein PilE